MFVSPVVVGHLQPPRFADRYGLGSCESFNAICILKAFQADEAGAPLRHRSLHGRGAFRSGGVAEHGLGVAHHQNVDTVD